MRIAQILLPDASHFDRKSQKIDRHFLSMRHDVIETTFADAPSTAASVAHVYGPEGFVAPLRGRFSFPYVAGAAPRRPRFRWPKRAEPDVIASPLSNLPEAVEEIFFSPPYPRSQPGQSPRVGTFGLHRRGVRQVVEQTLARIGRFRDDIEWRMFDAPPSPADLAGVGAWVDPATSENDYDGFVAEAIAAGKVVIASRTRINAHRLEGGRTGFLVPAADANELTHAILTALFKSEVALQKIEAARQTAGKFRPRQRLRALERIYETLTG